MKADPRPTVLVLLGCFNAADRVNGPTQSMITLAHALSDRFRFRVVARADPGETGRWTQMAGVERFPLRYDALLPLRLRRVISKTPHDLMISNGFFDRRLTIQAVLMRRSGLIPAKPFAIAPRGEFNPGALALKTPRKQAYLKLVRRFGLARDIHLLASDEKEKAAIKRVLPGARSILITPNIRGLDPLPPHSPRPPGEPLRIAFLSRIDPMKNLDLALSLLERSGIPVAFDIIGPTFNPAYWARCRKRIDAMPTRVPVRYLGPVPPDEVVPTLARYDLMLLPTAGENYGHAIIDSLVAGTPVLVSDRTPWSGLASARAGADLALEDESTWLESIRRFAVMDQEELSTWRAGARAYVEAALSVEAESEKVAQALLGAMGKRL